MCQNWFVKINSLFNKKLGYFKEKIWGIWKRVKHKSLIDMRFDQNSPTLKVGSALTKTPKSHLETLKF